MQEKTRTKDWALMNFRVQRDEVGSDFLHHHCLLSVIEKVHNLRIEATSDAKAT